MNRVTCTLTSACPLPLVTAQEATMDAAIAGAKTQLDAGLAAATAETAASEKRTNEGMLHTGA